LDKFEYVRLTDDEHRDMVVRMKGRDWWWYLPMKGWEETGIMIRYYSDESPYYDAYEEISEDQARRLINKNGGIF